MSYIQIGLLKFESPFLNIQSIYNTMISICCLWNLFLSHCKTYHLSFGFLFLFHVNDLFFFLPRCNKCKHYKAIEQALKSKICACRLDRESHKISCTDFPNWQDCLSNCNFMPTRFQTRSLGDCHQNLWSSEHWLWI